MRSGRRAAAVEVRRGAAAEKVNVCVAAAGAKGRGGAEGWGAADGGRAGAEVVKGVMVRAAHQSVAVAPAAAPQLERRWCLRKSPHDFFAAAGASVGRGNATTADAR